MPESGAENLDPIDAVVTWVDGNDPAHRAKRESALLSAGNSVAESGAILAGKNTTRFTDNGEISLCLHSIRKFAPWIRYIHLVTDNQIPAFLTTAKQRELGVRIVDHTEIFRDYEWALPTFNSRTVETVIWRIPEIYERFIYFNDDFILMNPVGIEDFYQSEKPVIRGKFISVNHFSTVLPKVNEFLNRQLSRFLGYERTMHLLLQKRSAVIAGAKKRFFRVLHAPQPLRKSRMHGFYDQRPDLIADNIKYRFRDLRQHSPIYASHQMEIESFNAITKDGRDVLEIDASKSDFVSRLDRAISKENKKFLCLQNLDKSAANSKAKCFDLLGALLK